MSKRSIRRVPRHSLLACILAFTLGCGLSGMAMAEHLLDVYALAKQNDPQLASAEATYNAALEAKPQSRAGVLPNISFSASGSRSENDTTYTNPAISGGKTYFTNYGYSLDIRQPLYRADNFIALEQADASIAQASAEYQAAQQDLIIRVAKAYFDVLSAQDNLHFTQAEKEAIARQLEQTKQRFEVGLTAITDVHEAQARYDLVIAQGIEAESQLDDSREALRQIIGEYPHEPATLRAETALPAPEPAEIEAWNKTALEQNLQLLAARFATEAAAIEVRRQRSGHQPTLDLLLSSSNSSGGNFVDETQSNSIALQFDLPLYTGGATSSAIRQSRFRHLAAQRGLEQQRRATEALTRNAYRGVNASIVRVRALKQAVISNQSALDATEAGYEVGTRTSVDVLNARRELFRAQRDYAQTRYDYINQSLRLKQAAGTLSPDDLQQINRWLKD